MTIATSNKDTKQFARVYSFFIFSSCSSFPCIALTMILIIIWMQPQWLWSNSNAIFHGLGSPSPSFWKKAPRNSHPVQSGLRCIWFGDALWSRWWWSCWRERSTTKYKIWSWWTICNKYKWTLAVCHLSWTGCTDLTATSRVHWGDHCEAAELRSALIYYYCYRTFLLLLRLVVK